MTNNIKYRKPIPIKALLGRSLEARLDNTKVYKPEVHLRMKAPEGYSPLLTPINNLNLEAAVPLSIALGRNAVSGSRLGPIGAILGIGATLLDHSMSRTKGLTDMIKSILTPRSRTLDRAETAPTDTVKPNPTSTTEEAQETSPGTDNKDNKDNKDKKSFRDRLADKIKGNSNKKESTSGKKSGTMLENLANIYKLAGKTLGYGIGLSPLAGAGYGIYLVFKPEQTSADSLINSKIKELEELNKLEQAMLYNNKINEIMLKLTNSSTTKNDSISFPTLQLLTMNLDAIADSIKAASLRLKSGQTQIYN